MPVPVEDPPSHPCTEDGESRLWPHTCSPALAFSGTHGCSPPPGWSHGVGSGVGGEALRLHVEGSIPAGGRCRMGPCFLFVCAVRPHLWPCFLPQSPCRPLFFLACKWEETGASGKWPGRRVQGERWHVGVEPSLGPVTHTISSFRTEKWQRSSVPRMRAHVQKVKAEVLRPFPKGPAPCPVRCPHCAWDDRHLSRAGKDEV